MVMCTLEQRFAKWACNRLIEDVDFGKKIIFSDEAHFDLDGYVNQQNCRICGPENTHAYVPHSRSYTRCSLLPVFEDRIFSRRVDVVWPPQSCDLSSLDYYLWSAVKDKYYAAKPETINALKDSIREAIGEIELHTIDNVLKKWSDRVGYSVDSRGSHFNEITLQPFSQDY